MPSCGSCRRPIRLLASAWQRRDTGGDDRAEVPGPPVPGEIDGEQFDLPDQSPHDINRYDVIKAVVRTESFVAEASWTPTSSC
ncbi:hypothetical protein CFP66_24120 [Pseudonocardia sp. MH-G8]|nr:hypothetical protein CFP66_24120 [Pseudonocardia sp. MH-G8]